MGDVAMTVPVISALAQQNPNCKITFVSRPFFEPFFKQIPNLTFFAVDLDHRHKGLLGLIRLFFDLKKLQITHFADLHNVLRSKIIRTLFSIFGIKTANTNKGRKEKKELTRSENKVFKPLKTMFERHVQTFQKLGFSVSLQNPVFPKKVQLSDKIKAILPQNASNIIGIAPFAQYQSKVYPQHLMQIVIDKLAQNQQNTILLFGGGEHEIKILNQLQNNHKNAIVIAGKLDLSDELDLISNLKVMLSMDSGNAHLASMFGVNVVTLWGATHPFAGFSPFNQPLENCLTSDRNKYPKLPTSVYGNKIIEGYQNAMETISWETIVNTLNKF